MDSQLRVQWDAAVDLLLGTDTLAQLGFSLTEREGDDDVAMDQELF